MACLPHRALPDLRGTAPRRLRSPCPFKTPAAASALISFAGLRGASAIVFAIVAYTQAPVNDIVFHVTFFIVLLSILFQGALLPFAAKKLSMIDHESDVMKSFTDYTEEMPVQFIQFPLPAGHAWCGQALSEIAFPPETLAILLSRGAEKIISNGDTRLSAGDTLVLSALSVAPVTGLALWRSMSRRRAAITRRASPLSTSPTVILLSSS